MYCRITLLALLILLASAAGCRQCQNCYDYCGPLPDEPCDFRYRKNSILYRGNEEVVADEATVSEPEDGMILEGDEGAVTPAPDEEGSAPQLSPVPDPSYSSGMQPRRVGRNSRTAL
ncbi:MAG TPA: hypothetical protein VMV69_13900 [Pirellulales bacterium]|nr:hypothetical protein [Pirellulales bacterium]